MGEFDPREFRQIIDYLLVMRDECRDESGLAVAVWQSAIDRATLGLAMLEQMADCEGVTVSAALSFLDEMETEPDGFGAALSAVVEHDVAVPCSFGDDDDEGSAW